MLKENNIYVTVFTPTNNRAKTLPELYRSLQAQTYDAFEWIVVDDGSTDNTQELVESWVNSEKKFKVIYYYQENNGKHIAMNRAVEKAQGELFTIVDSDDALLPDGIETLVNEWLKIPKDEWKKYSAVKAESEDMKTGVRLGPTFPGGKIVCSYLDGRYKKKIDAEMQSMVRTEVLREFPNPEILGGPKSGGLRFYPETIWQDLAGRKYQTIFIDKCTCKYRTDSSESLLGRGKKYNRYRENIYLWTHIINDNLDYFFYKPKEFIKAFVGISMDGIFNGYSFRKTIGLAKGLLRKIFVVIFYPAGAVCYLIKR